MNDKEKKAVLSQASNAAKFLISLLPPVPSQKPEKQPSKAELAAHYRHVKIRQNNAILGILRTIGYSSHIIPLYNDLRHSN